MGLAGPGRTAGRTHPMRLMSISMGVISSLWSWELADRRAFAGTPVGTLKQTECRSLWHRVGDDGRPGEGGQIIFKILLAPPERQRLGSLSWDCTFRATGAFQGRRMAHAGSKDFRRCGGGLAAGGGRGTRHPV